MSQLRHTENAVKADQRLTESRWDIARNSGAQISSEMVLLSRYIIQTLNLTEPIPPAELLQQPEVSSILNIKMQSDHEQKRSTCKWHQIAGLPQCQKMKLGYL